jgi:hypothetical protein
MRHRQRRVLGERANKLFGDAIKVGEEDFHEWSDEALG